MANIWEKYISILAGNLNSGLSYLITTVQSKTGQFQVQTWSVMKIVHCLGSLEENLCVWFFYYSDIKVKFYCK